MASNIRKPGSSDSVTSYNGDKRISDGVLKKLNFQISIELEASQLYRAMASWCEFKGYFSTAKFLNRHAEEELTHMKRIQKYLLDRNCMPLTPSISQQPTNFSGLLDVIKKAYEHEKYVSSTYESLAETVLSEKDHTTYAFSQWFLKEQVEEEALLKKILDKVEMMNREGVGILEIDEQVGNMGRNESSIINGC